MTKSRIIVIALVLVLIVAGAWYVLAHKSNSATPETSMSPTPVPSMVYNDVPSDWSVYASSALGFQVSYPKDWVVGSCGATCLTFADPADTQNPLIGINVTPGGNIDEVLTSAQPYITASGSETFNNIDWLRLVLQEPQTGNAFISHFAVSKDNLYEMGLGIINETTIQTYGEMVRSFRLTK